MFPQPGRFSVYDLSPITTTALLSESDCNSTPSFSSPSARKMPADRQQEHGSNIARHRAAHLRHSGSVGLAGDAARRSRTLIIPAIACARLTVLCRRAIQRGGASFVAAADGDYRSQGRLLIAVQQRERIGKRLSFPRLLRSCCLFVKRCLRRCRSRRRDEHLRFRLRPAAQEPCARGSQNRRQKNRPPPPQPGIRTSAYEAFSQGSKPTACQDLARVRIPAPFFT